MRSPRFARVTRFCSLVLLAGVCKWSAAAELGDASVSSYIGQPLSAEIELTGLADPASPVSVRNASMDVYRGANIAVSPVLPSLALTVVRRDNRQFLRLSSTRAVDAGYLHLFLELTEGGKQNVRGTTLWLSADPSPPPKPAPAPAPVAVLPRPAPAAPAPAPVALAARPVPPAAAQAPARETEPVRKPVREITLTGKAPPSCAQTEEQTKACAATEYKNGLLSAQVVELEEKVRQLQKIVDANAAASTSVASTLPSAAANADASAVAKAAAAAGAPHKPAIPPPPAKPPKHESEGLPWLLIGAIVAALAALGGGGLFWMKKRQKLAPPPAVPAAPPEAGTS
ncbi:MAG TPA: hypothetical protein VGC21_02210 [Telluria sp.]|jgi:pilus assembly protein FimV